MIIIIVKRVTVSEAPELFEFAQRVQQVKLMFKKQVQKMKTKKSVTLSGLQMFLDVHLLDET